MPTINVEPGDGAQLQDIANIMAKSKKFVVITGAGISTNCGIPDFRSENGLYSMIQTHYEAAAAASPQPTTADSSDIEPPPKRRRLERACSSRSSQTTEAAEDKPDVRSEVSPDKQETKKDQRKGRSKPDHATHPSSQLSQSSIPSSEDDAFLSAARRGTLPKLKGKDMFDSIIWSDSLSTSIFLKFIASLRRRIQTDIQETTTTHKFIRELRDGGRLVRCYTQNIDGLESREGLCTDIAKGPGSRTRFSAQQLKQLRENVTEEENSTLDPEKLGDGGCEVVGLHGTLDYLRCELCLQLCGWDEEASEGYDSEDGTPIGATLEHSLLAGTAPNCTRCSKSDADRRGKGRRSVAIGRLRPDIVLYGEEHPAAHLIAPIITHDLSLNPEVLLILGTSLRVHGLKVMVKEFAKAVHSRGGKVIFVNRTKPPESTWGDVIDYFVENDCDAWVDDLKLRRQDILLPQGIVKDPPKKKEASTTKAGKPKSDENESLSRSTSRDVDAEKPKRKSRAKGASLGETKSTENTRAKRKRVVDPSKPRLLRESKHCGANLIHKLHEALRNIPGPPRPAESMPAKTKAKQPPAKRGKSETSKLRRKARPAMGELPANVTSGRAADSREYLNPALYSLGDAPKSLECAPKYFEDATPAYGRTALPSVPPRSPPKYSTRRKPRKDYAAMAGVGRQKPSQLLQGRPVDIAPPPVQDRPTLPPLKWPSPNNPISHSPAKYVSRRNAQFQSQVLSNIVLAPIRNQYDSLSYPGLAPIRDQYNSSSSPGLAPDLVQSPQLGLPSSDDGNPMTPSEQRIKRLGSIDTMLSDPFVEETPKPKNGGLHAWTETLSEKVAAAKALLGLGQSRP